MIARKNKESNMELSRAQAILKVKLMKKEKKILFNGSKIILLQQNNYSRTYIKYIN